MFYGLHGYPHTLENGMQSNQKHILQFDLAQHTTKHKSTNTHKANQSFLTDFT